MTTGDEMMGGRELIEEIWPAQEPPANFAAQVLAAMDAPPEVSFSEPVPAVRRRRWPMFAVAGGAMAAAALIVVVLSGRSLGPIGASAGHHLARGRDTVNIADRAVAVAAPGSDLAWENKDGQIRVDQREGTVFYRVDRGGTFVVTTAVAEVHVTGTCFEVAIDRDAADRPAISVSLFEGSVILRNDRGELAMVAGEQARVDLDERPRRAGVAVGPSLDLPIIGGRDSERTAALEARVKQLETALRIASDEKDGVTRPGQPPRHKFFGLTGDERKSLAKDCELRYGFPAHLTRLERPDLEAMGVSEDERAAVSKLMDEHRNQYLEELRGLYDEIVGDPMARQSLSPMGLENEIWAKSSKEEQEEAKKRIMQEWAGLVARPAPGAARPSFERFLRLIVASGDEFVGRLTPALGPDRAREIGKQSVKIMARLESCPAGRK